MITEKIVRMGPAGNEDAGDKWDCPESGPISNILICHGDNIMGLRFQCVKNESFLWSEMRGSTKANKFSLEKIDYPLEHITGIRGHIGYYDRGISSISITTNRKTIGPFGNPGDYDTEFDFQLGQDSAFCGLFGTADVSGIKSLGVYLKLSDRTPPPTPIPPTPIPTIYVSKLRP